ncbi:MAG: FHA domain-containing protein [Deltaproteobacteria bacterium]|nr:FHA domain-containing protein [Deltaproteobacteria bacterium]
MKECSRGHLYPDTLDHCPVCDKGMEFQTIFENSYEEAVTLKKSEDYHIAAEQLAWSLTNKSNSNRNLEKTIFLGNEDAMKKNCIVGWLIEFNENELPINSYQLICGKTFLIGRDADCNIILNNKTISRKHCSIEIKEDQIIIHDNNSANGTIVDGTLIKSCNLDEKSYITLGELNFKIKYV